MRKSINTLLKSIACRRIEMQLWSYHADRLMPEERQQVDQHLAGCAACGIALAELAQTVALVTAYRENASVEPITGWHTLEARLLAQEQNKRPSPVAQLRMRTLSLAGGLAAVVLVCGIVWQGKLAEKNLISSSPGPDIALNPYLPSNPFLPNSLADYKLAKNRPFGLSFSGNASTSEKDATKPNDDATSPLSVHAVSTVLTNEWAGNKSTDGHRHTPAIRHYSEMTAGRGVAGKHTEKPPLSDDSPVQFAAAKLAADKSKVVPLRVVIAAQANVPKQDFVMPAIRTAADETVPKAYVMDTISNPSDKSAQNVTNASYSGSNGEKRTW